MNLNIYMYMQLVLWKFAAALKIIEKSATDLVKMKLLVQSVHSFKNRCQQLKLPDIVVMIIIVLKDLH